MIADQLEHLHPEDLLDWALKRFGRRFAVLTSFQDEGMVILDMALRLDPAVRLMTIDTGCLHPETHRHIDAVRERYGAAIEVLRNLRLGVLGVTVDRLPFLWQFLGYVVPLLMTFSAFALIYKVLPNVRVPLRVALVGALFAGVLWEVAKIGFAFYVGHFARTATVYGSLAGVILLQVWINVGAAITILGAEVASEWQKVSSGGCTAAPR